MHVPADPDSPSRGRDPHVSPRRTIGLADLPAARAAGDFLTDWETACLTLEMAGDLCSLEGRARTGSCLIEMHWWDRVRVGDSLHVHMRPLDARVDASGRAREGASLLWTVNQSGRCVFSCLALPGRR